MIRIHRHASSALKNSIVVDKAFYFINFEFFYHVSSCCYFDFFFSEKVEETNSKQIDFVSLDLLNFCFSHQRISSHILLGWRGEGTLLSSCECSLIIAKSSVMVPEWTQLGSQSTLRKHAISSRVMRSRLHLFDVQKLCCGLFLEMINGN